MELRLIRAFVAVAEDLHFTRAAEKLSLTPPSLSVQIRLLEQQLGVLLFRRTQRRVALTRAGEVLLPEARLLLEQAARLERRARDAARGEAGRIALGYVGSAAYSGILQAEIASFRAALPGVELQLREAPMRDLPGLVHDGAIDIAFVRWPLPLPRSLAHCIVLQDRFCLALPEAHPLARDGAAVAPEALAGAEFILPEQKAGTLEVARRGGFAPNVVAVPGHLAAVATLVSLGAGISVVPATLSRLAMPGVRFVEIAGSPIGSAIAAVFRRHEPSIVVARFIRHLDRAQEQPAKAG